MGKEYKHITQLERDRIQALLDNNHSQEDIAKILKRNKGTISREIKRNRRKKHRLGNIIYGKYESTVANHKAYCKRHNAKYQGMSIEKNKLLKEYVIRRLKQDQSPDEISGRMKKDKELFYASKTAIYDWLYSAYGQRYCQYLYSERYKPKKRKKKKTKRVLIKHRIGIELRPSVINNDKEYGHCEADTIVSGKKTDSKTALAVTYQRKAKYIGIKKIPSLKPEEFNKALLNIRKEQIINSSTLDNGIENQWHYKLDIPIYFCDPYSSWQKGGVENANKMIRRYIPKGSDISKYSDKYVKMIEDIINNKPRKSLGYKTPKEVMIENNLLLNTKESKNKKTQVALEG
jgi:transposase, IS30 family